MRSSAVVSRSRIYSVRPGITAVCGEVVGIGHATPHRRLGFEDLVGNAVPLAIGDRLLGRVKTQLDLLTHVARTGPAHQRFDFARLFRLVLEHPFLSLGDAGQHGGLRGLIDARRHVSRSPCARTAELWSGQQDLNLRPGVPKTLSAWPRKGK